MAVLGALLLIFGTRTLINIAFEELSLRNPAWKSPAQNTVKSPATSRSGCRQRTSGAPRQGRRGQGRPGRGDLQGVSCFEKDTPSPVGPNLHNVVGRKIASVEGFNYSPALKAKSGETWTYEHLDAMIDKAADFAPGTLMAFPGLPDAQQRADVLLFLRSKTDNPPPLPEVAAVAPEGGSAGP